MKKKNCLSLLLIPAIPLFLILLTILALWLSDLLGLSKNCDVAHNDRKTYASQICTDKKKYDFGEPIHITFTVTNISDETLDFNGGDKPALDILVEGERWLDERELTSELAHVTLEPGESHILNWVWPTPQTDLEPFKSYPVPSIFVFGTEISHPGALEGDVWVQSYYRNP
ncbi:MAG: hypothetical protein GY832_02825 [Chloroflexi bacterium]|nr:hypothetical protein [Chloroflexota bacterium]